MEKYSNELEQFIYTVCYKEMWNAVNEYVFRHPTSLDLQFSRIKYPDYAYVEDMILQFTRNVRIHEDTLSFEAVVSCIIRLEDSESHTADVNQWLIISCDALIEDSLKQFTVKDVCPFQASQYVKADGNDVSANLVPMMYKKDLEAEAEAFLKKYYPVSLEKPTPVPIEDIASNLGLNVVKGFCITKDLSVFGEICLSKGTVTLYDPFRFMSSNLDVTRGTIIIDANTYWERNLGCVNNTIAHEVYHWYKHRLYASIKHLLRNETMISCRCPVNTVYPSEGERWTDEQIMEWQANSMAPRILMPMRTFRMKVEELYKAYNYSDSPVKLSVLTCVADDLAEFYGVSRQSALIRMMETGFPEAASVYTYDSASGYHMYLTPEEAFREYADNPDLKGLVDKGLFVYCDGYYVINDSKYVDTSDGSLSLTGYAYSNLAECTLRFVYIKADKAYLDSHRTVAILHRKTGKEQISKYYSENNNDVVNEARSLQERRADFEKQNAIRKLTSTNESCWQLMANIIDERKLSKPHFCDLTGLGEEVYRKAHKNIETKPDLYTIVSFSCGLRLGLDTTNTLLKLAGHSFDNSDEHAALQFCVSGGAGRNIDEINEFLESFGYRKLGSLQRK